MAEQFDVKLVEEAKYYTPPPRVPRNNLGQGLGGGDQEVPQKGGVIDGE